MHQKECRGDQLEQGVDGLRFDSLTLLRFVLSFNYSRFTKTHVTQLVSMVTLKVSSKQFFLDIKGVKSYQYLSLKVQNPI